MAGEFGELPKLFMSLCDPSLAIHKVHLRGIVLIPAWKWALVDTNPRPRCHPGATHPAHGHKTILGYF